jgi:hypothetical protein
MGYDSALSLKDTCHTQSFEIINYLAKMQVIVANLLISEKCGSIAKI